MYTTIVFIILQVLRILWKIKYKKYKVISCLYGEKIWGCMNAPFEHLWNTYLIDNEFKNPVLEMTEKH